MKYIDMKEHFHLSPGEIIFLKSYLNLQKNKLAWFSDVQQKSGLVFRSALGYYSGLSKKGVLNRTSTGFISEGINFSNYVNTTK